MRDPGSTPRRAVRRALIRLFLALPTWAWALDFGFRSPRDPDDAAAADLMRDLAQRILPVYQEADKDAFLANVTALQIVSGAYRAALDSSKSLRSRRQGKPLDDLAERAILDGIYARARVLEADERLAFAEAYARAFQELVSPLDNVQAQAIMARLEIPPAVYRKPVAQAFDLWRAKGSLPEADALALVRAWLSYDSRRNYSALLPELFAAENRSRYLAEGDIRIPVRAGVIHANLVRPGRAEDALPTLLRFTLDPAEDDAHRSAVKGYVGVTAYVRGRTPDGKGAVWPFVRDSEDAVAVIEWIVQQPWSDGRVAMLGDGYSGYAAWAAARCGLRRSRPSPRSRRWRRASTSRWPGRSSATPWCAGRRRTRPSNPCGPTSMPTPSRTRYGRHSTRAGIAAIALTGTSIASCSASAAG